MLVLLGKLSKSFSSYLVDKNIQHALIADTNSNTKLPDGSTAELIQVDFANFEAVKSAAIGLQPSAILTDYEHYIQTAARLNHELGLPGVPLEVAHICTNKNLMRQAFAKNDPEISPPFRRVETIEDALEFADECGYPVMLKPTNLVKSLFITKNENADELTKNYTSMLRDMPAAYKQYGVLEAPEVIVESFMQGSMHTVAGFADADGNAFVIPTIADIETGRDRGSKENYLYSRMIPSKLPDKTQALVLETAQRGMRALGMKNSAAHVEIMLTEHGPKVIEIGARPGGYRPRMYREARGVDFYGAMVAVATGQPLQLEETKNGATCTVEVFPETEGIIKEISGKAGLEKLETLVYLSYRIPEGKKAGLPSQGYKSSVVITLASDDSEKVFADKHFIDEHVSIIVD